MSGLLALMALVTAPAEAHTVRICGQYSPFYSQMSFTAADDDEVDANGDGDDANDVSDFMTTYGPQPLRGLYAWAESQNPDGSWSFMTAGYLPVTGPDAGCTQSFSTTGAVGQSHAVRLKVYSIASSAGHLVASYDDEISQTIGLLESAAYPVQSSGDVHIDLGSGDSRFDSAIVSAWALTREDGGNDPMNLSIFHSNGAVGYPHWSAAEQAVYVPTSDLRKLLHELGHGLASNRMSDPSNPWTMTYAWSNIDPEAGSGDPVADSACSLPHDLDAYGQNFHYKNSDESTSAAILEGYADYYSAVVLNRTDEGDCFLCFGPDKDWDDDDTPDFGRWVSCEQRPVMLDSLRNPMPTTMNRDWWDHECAQNTNNVASEYDWLRGLWDLDTDEGYTYTELVEVLADAAPTTWLWGPDPYTIGPPLFFPTADCPADFQSGAKLACPYLRMGIDPATSSVRPGWLDQCDNGICR